MSIYYSINNYFHRRELSEFYREIRGVSAVEFAMVSPFMIFIILASLQFAIAFHNYQRVTNAVAVGARYFTLSRGASTPMTTTLDTMTSSLSNLAATGMSIVFSVNGTVCATDATCSAAMIPGKTAIVAAEYPCKIVLLGIDFAPTCKLKASVKGVVQ